MHDAAVKASVELSSSMRNVLRQLIYYSLFNYPLKRQEFDQGGRLENDLFELEKAGLISSNEEFFQLEQDTQQIFRRRHGNGLADKIWDKAVSRGKFIFSFPFVRAVYISGSMSKGFIDEEGDVDFFVITKPGRLWLCRTLLIAYKKIFLGNSRKYFCLNYFIDSENLEIEEQNIFTATELVTLIPVCDFEIHSEFLSANQWVREYYPHGFTKEVIHTCDNRSALKRTLEFLTGGALGKFLDQFFMKLTLNVWKKKFTGFEPDDFELALKSRTYVSKHHPRNFQKRVLDGYNEAVKQYEEKHGIDLGDR